MKRLLSTLAVALLAGLTMTGALAGPALAGHADTTDDVLIHEQPGVTDDLATVWVDIVGNDTITTSDSATNVTVTVEGLNTSSGGTNATLHTATLNVSAGATESTSYALNDSQRGEYDTLNFTVEMQTSGHSQYVNESATEWGTTVTHVGGGGGSLVGGNGAMGGLAALVILGAGYFILSE